MAITAGDAHSVCVKSDGTMMCDGRELPGRCQTAFARAPITCGASPQDRFCAAARRWPEASSARGVELNRQGHCGRTAEGERLPMVRDVCADGTPRIGLHYRAEGSCNEKAFALFLVRVVLFVPEYQTKTAHADVVQNLRQRSQPPFHCVEDPKPRGCCAQGNKEAVR